MKKRKIFEVLIIFVIIIVVSAGCEKTDLEPKEIGEKFYVIVDYSAFQEVYNEGFPKDLKAKAFLGKKELNNNLAEVRKNIDWFEGKRSASKQFMHEENDISIKWGESVKY